MATGSLPAERAGQSDERALVINARLFIPRSELTVRATRASGAGGQHVNKTATRVEVRWNVAASSAVSADDRARLVDRLGARLSEDGELRVVASDTRSQLQNRQLAEFRLAGIVRRALTIPKARRPTKPTRASKEARLSTKRRRSDTKRDRRAGSDD